MSTIENKTLYEFGSGMDFGLIDVIIVRVLFKCILSIKQSIYMQTIPTAQDTFLLL